MPLRSRAHRLFLSLFVIGAISGTAGTAISLARHPGRTSTKHAVRVMRHVRPRNDGAQQSLGAGDQSAPFFSPSSFWNQPLSAHAPLDPNSAGMIWRLSTEFNSEELLKRGPWINSSDGGAAIVVVGPDQPSVQVKLDHAPDAALTPPWSAVPLPPTAKPADGDRDLAVWQPSTDRMWEFIGLRNRSDGWHASWGGAMRHVSANPGVYGPDAWPGAKSYWGVTATSLPLVGGAMTLPELARGVIDHALAMAIPNVRAGVFASPAHRTDGVSSDPGSLPEGAHLRLDPSLNLASLDMPPLTRMMARAAQRYGIIVRDYAPNIAFIAQAPPAIGPDLLYQLRGGLYPTQLLAYFPWSHLQVLKLQLHKRP